MSKPLTFNDSGDSQELQSLFDSIAAQPRNPPAHGLVITSDRKGHGDTAALETLFDNAAGQAKPDRRARQQAGKSAPQTMATASKVVKTTKASKATKVTKSVKAGNPASIAAAAQRSFGADSFTEPDCLHDEEVFNRIGQMARQLHDTLTELGYDHALEDAVKVIPNARQRLDYIAHMTEQAASRVLNATDIAKPIQDSLAANARALNTRWNQLYSGDLSADEFKALAHDTRAFIADVPTQASATGAQLMEIMMAQDFQDLTGQVIKKIVDLAQTLETQLVQVLIQSIPTDRRSDAMEGMLNGPVIDRDHPDAVANQEQVDDLLESLGF